MAIIVGLIGMALGIAVKLAFTGRVLSDPFGVLLFVATLALLVYWWRQPRTVARHHGEERP